MKFIYSLKSRLILASHFVRVFSALKLENYNSTVFAENKNSSFIYEWPTKRIP